MAKVNTMNRWMIVLMTTFLTLSGLTMAPGAAAHDCADHENCDAGGCVDGEDHHHTDYNADTEDGVCESKAPPNSCKFLGKSFAGKECTLIRDGKVPAGTDEEESNPTEKYAKKVLPDDGSAPP